jgi:xanthine dehydrogenase accessory factor
VVDADEACEPTLYEALRDSLRAQDPITLATVVASGSPASSGVRLGAKLLVGPGDRVRGTLGNAPLDAVVTRDARGALASGHRALRHYGARGEARQDAVSVYVETFGSPPRMIIFGAVDFSSALAAVGKILGFRVTVCDARAVFATRARFRAADEVVVEWPDRYLEREGPSLGARDAVCVLTHDTKFDVPAIVGALATQVGYIGAMGSRRTKEKREMRLREAGVTDAQFARVHAPIGLDIGARTPEETAVSICAEIIAARTGTSSIAPLSQGTGPIHRGATVP